MSGNWYSFLHRHALKFLKSVLPPYKEISTSYHHLLRGTHRDVFSYCDVYSETDEYFQFTINIYRKQKEFQELEQNKACSYFPLFSTTIWDLFWSVSVFEMSRQKSLCKTASQFKVWSPQIPSFEPQRVNWLTMLSALQMTASGLTCTSVKMKWCMFQKQIAYFTLSLVQGTFSNSWLSEEVFSLNYCNFITVNFKQWVWMDIIN